MSRLWQIWHSDIGIWDTEEGYFALSVPKLYSKVHGGRSVKLVDLDSSLEGQGLHLSLSRHTPLLDRYEHLQVKGRLFIDLAEHLAEEARMGRKSVIMNFKADGNDIVLLCKGCPGFRLFTSMQHSMVKAVGQLRAANRPYSKWWWPYPHIRFPVKPVRQDQELEQGREQLKESGKPLGQDQQIEREGEDLNETQHILGKWAPLELRATGEVHDLLCFLAASPSEWVKGSVNWISKYGIWVDVKAPDGTDRTFQGVVSLSDVRDGYVYYPASEVSVGQEVDVRIIDIDRSKGRLSLSMKQETPVMGISIL